VRPPCSDAPRRDQQFGDFIDGDNSHGFVLSVVVSMETEVFRQFGVADIHRLVKAARRASRFPAESSEG